jgi:hypothetical protein
MNNQMSWGSAFWQMTLKIMVGVQIQIQNNKGRVFKSSSKKGKLKKGKEARKGEKRETKTGLEKPGKNRRLSTTDRNALANRG